MKAITRAIVSGSLILLTACATPLTQKELTEIHTVGIVNNFPEYPNFTNIGTTMFNNEYDKVEDPSFKQFLTDQLARRLGQKGLSVKEIPSENAAADTDMVLIVIPRDVYNMVDTFGYGFYQRSMFGANAFEKSYAALNLSPVVGGKTRCSACYGESLTDLPIDKMPGKWSDLTETQKARFTELLKTDITNAIDKALLKAGL